MDEIKHILTERDILTTSNSDWLVKLLYAFQDETTIRHSEVQQESEIGDRTTSSYSCMISKHKVADSDWLESDSASIKTSCSYPYPGPEMQ